MEPSKYEGGLVDSRAPAGKAEFPASYPLGRIPFFWKNECSIVHWDLLLCLVAGLDARSLNLGKKVTRLSLSPRNTLWTVSDQ